jgi:GNAT superfamily N-acetyltransferase
MKGAKVVSDSIELQQTSAQRVEEASLNAWPAMQQMLIDGWVLRFSKGFTKRSNSIVPLYPSNAATSSAQTLEKIRYCENLYAREQLQTVFRLTDIDPSNEILEQQLDARGYRAADPSLVLALDLNSLEGSASNINLNTLEDWLTVYCALTGMDEPTRTLHRLILNAIGAETGFATLLDQEVGNNKPLACGLGVVEHDLLGLFDIFTHPEHRRQRLGHDLIKSLLHWGSSLGAKTAYLQVVADNSSARRLYENMGFKHIYRYWYRTAP